MYARSNIRRNDEIREESKNGYRIPPGYHGNAFLRNAPTDGMKIHSPHVYAAHRVEERKTTDSENAYVPVQEPTTEQTVSVQPEESSLYTNPASAEESTYEGTIAQQKQERNFAQSFDTERAEQPLETGVMQRRSNTEQDRLLGEMLRTLLHHLRREDWLLTALLLLFILDGSATPDILLLLALLLAFHT